MRLGHLEALAPVCPWCRQARQRHVKLVLGSAPVREGDDVVEGVLHCSDRSCFLEYPILDGIPVLLPNARGYIAQNLAAIMRREDLGPLAESLLGDAAGPGSAHDLQRQHLSTYAWDAFAAADPAETRDGRGPHPGAVQRCLAAGLDLLGPGEAALPAVDLGCAVGGAAFALAQKRSGLVLGVDLNFAMLRLARRVLREGKAVYWRRRVGVVYDRREIELAVAGAERLDFWACDALALPFPPERFGLAVALNLLDCLPAPRELLAALPGLLAAGGRAVLTTPYDWSPVATPFEAWIGGHSQRGEGAGASEIFLRTLLTPGAPGAIDGLRRVAETADFPWATRLHDRSFVDYRVHVMAVERA